jgi:hypothetical protein
MPVNLDKHREEITTYWEAGFTVERILEIINKKVIISKQSLEKILESWGFPQSFAPELGSRGYIPQRPLHDTLIDSDLCIFISNFYRCSDDPDGNEKWVSFFELDATVIMGTNRAQGSEEIAVLREGMWDHVKERTHLVTKVFPARFENFSNQIELMLFGDVNYRLKGGRFAAAGWSAHAVLFKKGIEKPDEMRDEGTWKFAFYKVWKDDATFLDA